MCRYFLKSKGVSGLYEELLYGIVQVGKSRIFYFYTFFLKIFPIENWTISSWSSCTQSAYIMKRNIGDREKLPDATMFNALHRTRRILKRKNPCARALTRE